MTTNPTILKSYVRSAVSLGHGALRYEDNLRTPPRQNLAMTP